MRENSRKALDKAKQDAVQRENELNSKIEATKRRAKESAVHAQAQQRELSAALKSAQAALEDAQKTRDEALKQTQALQQQLEETTAALEEAQRRLTENKFTKKLLEAVSLRREDKSKSKDSE